MPQLFDYSGIGQNYLRDQALQQEIEQRKKSFPISNALASAQLQDYLRNQQDTAAIRQTAQQNNQMTVNPEPPKPDAFGNMQLNQSGAPNQTENTIVAVFKKYISQGKIKEATDTLDTYTKPMLLSGNVDEAARVSSRALGVPLVPTPDRKDIMLAKPGEVGFNIKTMKQEFAVPEANKPPTSMGQLAAEAYKGGKPDEAQKILNMEHPDKSTTDFTAKDRVALAAQAQKLGKSVNDLTPAEQNAALTAPKDPEMEALRKAMLAIGIANAKTQLTPDAAVEQMAQSIVDGRSTPSQLSSMGRSKVRSQIMARVYELNPEYDQMSAEAGLQAGNKNQKQIRALDAVGTGLDVLEKASKEFKRTDIGLLNRIVLGGEIQVNDEKAINFQTSLQGVIDDLASALSGGGATTDQSRNQATKIFNQAYSAGGIDSAIKTVRKIIAGRRARFSSGTVYSKDSRLTQPTGSPTPPAGSDPLGLFK
jgi:hypothetical protein